MIWTISHRCDRPARELADRHYNRQSIGANNFVPPGRCLVLLSRCRRAVWVTSWPFAEFTKHAWAGAWVNSLFRNEGAGLSSDLIREAVAITAGSWDPPPLGMVTFVDASKVRHKRDPGRCYTKAGFQRVGETKGGLVALQLLPANMPKPIVIQGSLFSAVPAADQPSAWSTQCLPQFSTEPTSATQRGPGSDSRRSTTTT